MRRLTEGTLDIGLMYTPQQQAGLQVEYLFDEVFVLVSSDPDKPCTDENYVYVDWDRVFTPRIATVFPNSNAPRS